MKKFILSILLFGIIFIAINFIYIEILKRFDWNFSKSVEASNFQNKTFDCLVFGSSFVLDGIDTEYLSKNGIYSYNFAIGGASLKSNLIQLNKYLKHNKKPKYIIVGLGSSFNQKFDSKKIQPIVSYNYDIKDSTFINSLPLLKFKWLSHEVIKRIISKDHRNIKIVNGQLKIKKKVSDKSNYDKFIIRNLDTLKYTNSEIINKINTICKTNKIELIMIEMPGFKSTQNDIPIKPYLIKSETGSYNLFNLNNKDFCSKTFDNNKDWIGNSHLNEYGARKLTKYILENCVKRH